MSTSPTSGGTSQPIRIGNFFSSFDTEAVLNQLQTARQAPIAQLTRRQQVLAQRKTAVAQLVTQFSTLLSRTNSLLESTSTSGKTAFSNSTAVSAAAGPSATPGTFSVAVNKLATGTSLTGAAVTAAVNAASTLANSNFGTTVTAGTFTLKAATGTTVTITVDPATQSLNDIVNAINAQTGTSGITASLQNDANGRQNILQLTSTMGTIQVGSGGDTSNFLTATNLLASPGTTTRASTLPIARINLGSTMATATFFAGAPAGGAQTLTINGTAISYDAATDSLNDMITRINASAAGVTASYDPATDKLKLTQTRLGSVAMSLNDTGGFLTATGLSGASQVLGDNADYSVNGGASQYATSNTVSIGNGITLTLNALTAGTPATITVAQDTGAATSLMNNFVRDFNSLLGTLNDMTSGDKANPGVFSGDAAMLTLRNSLRGIIGSTGTNVVGKYQTLGSIGLSFGAVGSAVGTTNTLQLDSTRFQAALQGDPVAVQSLLSTFTLSANLAGGGTSSVTGIAGTYTGPLAGSWAITDDGAGHLSATFTPTDGSAPYTQTATVTASSTNTTLIPGITLSIGALQAGTSTVNVSVSAASVFRNLKTFLEGQAGANGTLSKRSDEFTNVSKDIDDRKARIQAAVDSEIALLRQKFVAMEQAQARASSVMQSLQKFTNQSTSGG